MESPWLVLASKSPRRRRLIGLLGLPYQALAVELDEAPRAGEAPEQLAARLAFAKARAVGDRADARLVVAADSVVVFEGQALGKPGSADEAAATLRRLRGRLHQVVSGVTLLDGIRGLWHRGVVRTEVRMRAYGEEEIAAYVLSGAPMDKAGSYGIQDRPFRPVEGILGCYLNVVGLPLCEVARGLVALGCLPTALAQEPFIPPCRLCLQGGELLDDFKGSRPEGLD